MNYTLVFNILSNVLLLDGCFLLLPYVASLVYHERCGLAYLICAVACVIIGLIGRKVFKSNRMDLFAQDGLVITALAWILISLVGSLPLFFSGEYPRFIDCVFESISGFTTTGAGVLNNIEHLSHCNLLWRSLTHWIGGMGVLVLLMAILPLSGSSNIHLMRAESPGPEVGKIVPRVRNTAAILYRIYTVFTLVEMIALMIAGCGVFNSIVLACSTVGTGGFAVLNSSIASYNIGAQVIIIIFMILCSMNFYIYYLILTKRWKDALKYEETRWYLGVIIVAVILITVNVGMQISDFGNAFHQAAFTVPAIISTTGFGITDHCTWPFFSQVVLMIVMLIGGCAGSTGGGMKMARIIVVLKSIRNEFTRLTHPRSVKKVRLNGKNVADETIRGVFAFLSAYFVIALISILLIAWDGHDVATSISAAITCLSNVGPGLGEIGPSGSFADFSILSKIVLSLDMLLGRLEIFALLILFNPSTWKRRRQNAVRLR